MVSRRARGGDAGAMKGTLVPSIRRADAHSQCSCVPSLAKCEAFNAPILSALRVVDCVEKHAFRKDLLPTTEDMLLTFISGLPRQVASPQKLSQRYQGLTQASRDAAPPPPPAMVRYHTLLWNQQGRRLEEGIRGFALSKARWKPFYECKVDMCTTLQRGNISSSPDLRCCKRRASPPASEDPPTRISCSSSYFCTSSATVGDIPAWSVASQVTGCKGEYPSVPSLFECTRFQLPRVSSLP
jgi:hypothetical protein